MGHLSPFAPLTFVRVASLLHLIIGKGGKDELHSVAAGYRVIGNTASFRNRIKTRLT